MTKKDAFSLMSERISTCQRCKLGKYREETNGKTVPGNGNLNPKFMIISEAPGQQESTSGLPFVGRSGTLLTKLLSEVGIDREKDCFISNIIKCRPPDNRDPEPDECVACRPFLNLTIELVNPKGILLLGKVAAVNVLAWDKPDKDKLTIGSLRGKLNKIGSKIMVASYHPSFLLRNRNAETAFFNDVHLLLKNL